MMRLTADQRWMAGAGLLLGLAGSLLAYLGNPVNTGICISCFLENAAGALGLHANPRMQYIRPELLGFFLGSFFAAFAAKELSARTRGAGFGGAILGFLMILGSAVFIGCPIKMVLRLAAGDFTAVAGAAGLIAGVKIGLIALAGPDTKFFGEQRKGSTPLFAMGVAAIAVITVLSFIDGPLQSSTTGGGSLRAPGWIALLAGLGVGAACQRSRFCITGSLRDIMLTRSPSVGWGLITAFSAALFANILTGQLNPGYADQPGVHLEWIWSFLGMALTGWAAILAGGCPFRQLVKAGEGDLDAWSVTLGMVAAAILVQNWSLGATVGGVYPQAKAATLIGFAVLAGFSLSGRRRNA